MKDLIHQDMKRELSLVGGEGGLELKKREERNTNKIRLFYFFGTNGFIYIDDGLYLKVSPFTLV